MVAYRVGNFLKCGASGNFFPGTKVRFSTVLQHEEKVAILDQSEPMGDNNTGHRPAKFGKRLSNQTLRSNIDGTCRLIHDEESRCTG